MAVTPTLANQLYQQLGEAGATGLTEWLYTMETTTHDKLERLNEANYARFRAEMRAGFAEHEARFTERISDLRVELRSDIARVEARLAWQMLATVLTLVGVMVALGEKFLRI